MGKERRLGRGLEALLGRTARGDQSPEPTRAAVATRSDSEVVAEETPRLYQAPEIHDTTETSEAALPSEVLPSETSAAVLAVSATSVASATSEPELASELELDSEPDAGSRCEPDMVQVDVRLIEPNPFQPRRDFGEESLNSLSESIADHGLLQPLVVRRIDESYQLIAGERRFRAAQKCGLHEVPVRVIEADDRRMSELAIVENLQRKDLNSLEKAGSFRQYMESHGSTQTELAKRLKIDRSTIANLVRLLDLPESVKELLNADRITQGHARALLPLGEERLQTELCARVEAESLTVRDVERLVREMISGKGEDSLAVIDRAGKKRKPTPTDDQLAALEQQFRTSLGMKVKLTQTSKGRGKLVVTFSSHEEFERLRDQLLSTARPQERAG